MWIRSSLGEISQQLFWGWWVWPRGQLSFNTSIHLTLKFWKLHEDVLAINVWCFTFIKKRITFSHSEISHSFWTVSRFGIVNLVICAALHSEVLFLRYLPVCFGACMDNHHGHNCWTLKQTFLKPKRKEKMEWSVLALIYHSYKLQWWQPAGLFASWTTNRWEIIKQRLSISTKEAACTNTSWHNY